MCLRRRTTKTNRCRYGIFLHARFDAFGARNLWFGILKKETVTVNSAADAPSSNGTTANRDRREGGQKKCFGLQLKSLNRWKQKHKQKHRLITPKECGSEMGMVEVTLLRRWQWNDVTSRKRFVSFCLIKMANEVIGDLRSCSRSHARALAFRALRITPRNTFDCLQTCKSTTVMTQTFCVRVETLCQLYNCRLDNFKCSIDNADSRKYKL